MPDFDVAVVRRLKEAGFVVIGKTNTPELGITAVTESQLNGVCRNPWDTTRYARGVERRRVGCRGRRHGAGRARHRRRRLDPNPGLVLRHLRAEAGPRPRLARAVRRPRGLLDERPADAQVADAAALLDVMAGYETGDAWWAPPPDRPFADGGRGDPGRLRVAVTTTPPLDAEVAPECVAAAEDAAALLTELGHDVEEATPPWDDGRLIDLFMTVWTVIPGLKAKPRELFEPMNRALLDAGDEMKAVDYVAATQSCAAGRAGWSRSWASTTSC